MKITGIIAEYNPFHKGHAYHLSQAKALTGADYLVVVQSGDFVQRGAPALVDQHVRARMALEEGADLVLSLPSAYACASAETFAGGAVSLLNGLNCVDALCFGSECGRLSLLSSYAQVLAEEPAAYQDLLRAFLKQGCSYPLARSKALHEYFSYTDDILPCSLDDNSCRYESEILSQPNNTLGVEYLKALYLLESPIRPYTIARRSADYHDASLDREFASATAIRKAICSQDEIKINAALQQLPPKAGNILKRALEEKGPVLLNDFSSILHYKLLSLSEEALASYTDISPELAARMKNQLLYYRSAASFADLLKTKQLTHTRITRAFCHILLEDKQEHADQRKALSYPVYGRILGFRRESQPLLSLLKQCARIPLISRMADGEEILAKCPCASPKDTLAAKERSALFSQDLFASHVYEAMAADKYETEFSHEYMRQICIIE